MTMRTALARPLVEPVWTPRQREVLDLLVRGHTNGQIADVLGISLDGAKWHVSEIITRLGVDSREEAAEYWRAQNGLRLRFTRLVRALVPGSLAIRWLGVGVAAGVASGIAVALVFAIQAMRGDDGSPAAPADSTSVVLTPTPPATATVTAGVTTLVVAGAILSDGRSGYAYQPQVAYTDANGVAWRVSADGKDRVKLLEGCTGLGSAKRGDVVNGGLQWSAAADKVACVNDALAVRVAAHDGTGAAEPFATGACAFALEMRLAPDGRTVACGGTVKAIGGGQLTLSPAPDMNRLAWSPNGRAFIAATGIANAHVSYSVFDVRGKQLGRIDGAYVGHPAKFAWTRDGGALAYPGPGGIHVIDLAAGWSERTLPLAADMTGGGDLAWVLDDRALLVKGYPVLALLDRATGAALPVPKGELSVRAVAPDGRRAAAIMPGATAGRSNIAVVNLESGDVRTVAGSDYASGGIGLSPEFMFAGDSSRFCWTPRPGNEAPFFCADTAGGPATAVSAPVQVEPDVLGRGDIAVLWRAFSPDLKKVAYTIPGLSQPGAPQVLWIANLDGSGRVEIGPAGGVLPYEWRPDGVWRPANQQ